MMSPRQWSLLLATGTNHLLAISGLHIGLVAGLCYLTMLRLWPLGGRLCLKWPAQRGAALTALGVACLYAMLAGFTVPTQRAVLMLSVVMGAVIFNRVARPMHTLAFALLVVLIWDSLAVLSVGFWLSFGAVAVIFYAVIGRLAVKRPWWHWGKTQWILAIGLFPLVLIFFQRASLVGPLANLIAVPWVGLLVVPVTLAGGLSAVVFPAAGVALLGLASTLLDFLWAVLDLLIRVPLAVWHHSPPAWALLPAMLGIALLLAPRGWPGRWLGVIFFSPLVLVSPARPELGGYWITLLDVGQGLSIVIQTHNHTLLYDTGPKFSEYFNAGDAAVLPYLRSRDIDSIDLMLVSHGDSDHMGGADAIKEAMRIERILTSVPEQIGHPKVEHCVEGMGWHWDGVEFELLHPTTQQGGEGNDQSCVLSLRGPGGSTLITGDIESDAERRLLETYGGRLASDIMQIPHHGSLTSSSLDFVEAVNPRIALLSVGFHNRFGLPSQRVTDRYKAFGVKVLDTPNHGAVSVFVHPAKGIEIGPGYRQSDKRYWSGVSTDI
jgi:competence protein ComEC